MTVDFDALPGGDLVAKGLRDLAAGHHTIESCLVLVGRPRLRDAGVDVPPQPFDGPPEHALYHLLAAGGSDSAHSRYNALIRRLVSFERALECVS